VKTRVLFALLLLLPFLAAAGESPSKLSSAAISEETRRSHQEGGHLISVWWLPVEYWEAAARELRKSDEEIDRVRELLETYCILGLVDAQVSPKGTLQFAELESVNKSLALVVGTQRVGPAPRLDPALKRYLPELSYFMSAGLGAMSGGLRLVLFPNVDDKGQPQMNGASDGEIHAIYTPEGGGVVKLLWHAPLTAVVGPKRCPEGGEELEASWRHCPWHGVRVD
jgi:hypothetical protein